jgi:hypothetical protein
MSTSQTTTGLSKPTADNKISLGDFGYINARNRQRAYDIVMREFEASGMTQAALASRMGKTPDVICRLLSRPQNWEADTFSSLLYAISGAVPKYDVFYPLGRSQLAAPHSSHTKSSSSESAKVIDLMDAIRKNIYAEKASIARSVVEPLKASVAWR